jgi:2-dehydro-3-deoxyphosphogluconate aldolase/(4S)-4-hydroxy-2-oxoglutarate aldolase
MAALGEQRVVPVLRSQDWRDAVATARACVAGGCRVVELTLSTPEVERAVEALAADDAIVGAGTLTSARQVEALVSAGATFVVSFCRPEGFVAAAHALDVPAIPGAQTPSEIQACVADGADAVKLFPARLLTPSYLREVRPLFPGVPMIATGGLAATAESVGPWLEAGALAVGVGSDVGTAASVGADEVTRRCRSLLSVTPGVAA